MLHSRRHVIRAVSPEVGLCKSLPFWPLLANQIVENSARPGDRRYKDVNSRDSEGNLTGVPDGIIDEADRVPLGQASPRFIWGLNNNFTYYYTCFML